MDKEQDPIFSFLYEQWLWLQQQDLILAKIEGKLRAMKAIAEYRLTDGLCEIEVQRLQVELAQLKQEILALERELNRGIVN